MSVVVAYANKQGCYMVGDSAAANEQIVFESSLPKTVVHAGGGIVGVVGSWRIINLINECKNKDLNPKALIEMLKELRGEEDLSDSEILFAYPNKPLTFLQTSGLSTIELKSPFFAIGVGGQYALGYLSAFPTLEEKHLIGAVNIAATYSPYVIKPAKLVKLVTKG